MQNTANNAVICTYHSTVGMTYLKAMKIQLLKCSSKDGKTLEHKIGLRQILLSKVCSNGNNILKIFCKNKIPSTISMNHIPMILAVHRLTKITLPKLFRIKTLGISTINLMT